MNWLICLILGPPVGKSEKEKLSLVQRPLVSLAWGAGPSKALSTSSPGESQGHLEGLDGHRGFVYSQRI